MADRSLLSALLDQGVAIYVIPAFGGTEHRLYYGPAGLLSSGLGLVARWQSFGLYGSRGQEPRLDCLAFARRFHHTTAHVTVRSGGRLLALLSRPTARPWLSSEGLLRVWWRTSMSCSAAGGTPKRLTFDNTWIMAASHLDSGRPRYRVLFRAWRSRRSLAHIRFRRNTTAGCRCRCDRFVPFHFSKRQSAGLYAELIKDNIWRLNLKDEKHRQGPPAVSIRRRA